MSNRVEELESKVAELQAAVNGLTEELVETKERVRQLEDAAELEVDVPEDAPPEGFRRGASGDVGAEVSGESPGETDDEGAKSDENEGSNGEEATDLEDSDIIVA